MATDERIRAREDQVAWRRVADEVIVLDLNRNTYLSINASGVGLWESIQGEGATQDDLVRSLVETFGVDEPRASGDVADFVALLAEKGLLR